jgi:CBS domain-containing protein
MRTVLLARIMKHRHYTASDEVKELMSQNVTVISPDERLIRAANLMYSQGVGALPVVEEDMRLIGIITERDVCRLLGSNPKHIEKLIVKDGMSTALVYVQPEETLDGVIRRMSEYHYRRIPVVSDGVLVGIISQTDFLNHYPELISSHRW